MQEPLSADTLDAWVKAPDLRPALLYTRRMTQVDRRAPCPCGSGRRYKSCCLARDRAREDASAAAAAAHERIDRALRRLLPVVRESRRVACDDGCSACCSSYVRATPAEGLLVASHLLRPEQDAARTRFLERLPGWREGARELGPRIEALLEDGDRSDAAEAAYMELSTEYLRRGNRCPFLTDDRCDIYPVRPSVCRSVYVVETGRYCQPDQGRLPEVVLSPVLDEAISEAAQALRHASRGLGGDGRTRPLPEAVARFLGVP